MFIDFEEKDHWLVARPSFQRLDASSAQEFTSSMVERCSGSDHVVLDLTSVTFIDSRGLAALVSVFKLLSTGGVLRLANLNDQVELLLTMTRLKALVPAFGSVDAAIQA